MIRTKFADSKPLLERLARWVEVETPTTDPAAVNRLVDIAQADLRAAGAEVHRTAGQKGFGDVLSARVPGGSAKPILLLGHLDTVWPKETLAAMPFRVDGDLAYGPGIYDMKAGSFLAVTVIGEMLRQHIALPRPVVLLLTPDEEMGSLTSRPLIEDAARDAAAVLVLEPAGAGGACVTGRKGVGRFTLEVTGRAAHAGSAFRDGASAVFELAEQLLAVRDLIDLDAGITLNAAPISGGTRSNVIADHARAEIDLRVPDDDSGKRLTARILGLAPRTKGCDVRITGGMNRPPFAETKAIAGLYETAKAVADEIGIALPKQYRGGGSDGNFTAALAIPTLDGLGCPGGGAHATNERVFWPALAPRARLLAGLIERI